MSDIRVATRYAKSLFDLAGERGTLARIEEDARAFTELCQRSRDFDNMLKSPIINPDKKKAVLKKIFGEKFDKLTMSFIDIVLRKRREMALDSIFRQFSEMYKEKQGVISATVYTAVPVTEKIKKDILTYLEKETSKTVELHTSIDHELIGGFVVRYEDKLIDASVASQLRALRTHLVNNN